MTLSRSKVACLNFEGMPLTTYHDECTLGSKCSLCLHPMYNYYYL